MGTLISSLVQPPIPRRSLLRSLPNVRSSRPQGLLVARSIPPVTTAHLLFDSVQAFQTSFGDTAGDHGRHPEVHELRASHSDWGSQALTMPAMTHRSSNSLNFSRFALLYWRQLPLLWLRPPRRNGTFRNRGDKRSSASLCFLKAISSNPASRARGWDCSQH